MGGGCSAAVQPRLTTQTDGRVTHATQPDGDVTPATTCSAADPLHSGANSPINLQALLATSPQVQPRSGGRRSLNQAAGERSFEHKRSMNLRRSRQIAEHVSGIGSVDAAEQARELSLTKTLAGRCAIIVIAPCGSGCPKRMSRCLWTRVCAHADEGASGALMTFARADCSEENLEFWFAASDFQRAWDAKGDAEHEGRAVLAREIIERFLKANAEKQVCIGDRRVQSVIDLAGQGTFSREMFVEAQQIAKFTLEQGECAPSRTHLATISQPSHSHLA